MLKQDIFNELDKILHSRRSSMQPEKSYVSSLYKKGEEVILKKIIEEALETTLASRNLISNNIEKNQKIERQKLQTELIKEVADLWFHSAVLLHFHNLSIHEVMAELQNRFGISGIAEKNIRNKK